MMTTVTCPSCGAAEPGNFCARCGTPVREAACPDCRAPLSAGARFCRSCGRATGGGAPAAGAPAAGRTDRRPWIVAGAALVALLGALLFTVSRSQAVAPPAESVMNEPLSAGEAPPDIANMTPRERFDRLYERVLKASQTGDEATVARFTPMALAAYAMLDSVDTDARYHAAVLRVHTGDAAAAQAIGDSIVAAAPDHLFGYMARGTSARWRKDEAALKAAYGKFLARYPEEMKANRPEYAEHKFSVEEFRKAAERGP
jgi:hypothetical protein